MNQNRRELTRRFLPKYSLLFYGTLPDMVEFLRKGINFTSLRSVQFPPEHPLAGRRQQRRSVPACL